MKLTNDKSFDFIWSCGLMHDVGKIAAGHSVAIRLSLVPFRLGLLVHMILPQYCSIRLANFTWSFLSLCRVYRALASPICCSSACTSSTSATTRTYWPAASSHHHHHRCPLHLQASLQSTADRLLLLLYYYYFYIRLYFLSICECPRTSMCVCVCVFFY